MKALTRYQFILLRKQRHIGVNNLLKVVARELSLRFAVGIEQQRILEEICHSCNTKNVHQMTPLTENGNYRKQTKQHQQQQR